VYFLHYYPIIGGIVEKEEKQKTPKGYKLVLGWVLVLSWYPFKGLDSLLHMSPNGWDFKW
jgi:hypothetical protein